MQGRDRSTRIDRRHREKQGRIHRLEHANAIIRRSRRRFGRFALGNNKPSAESQRLRPIRYGERPMRIERRNTTQGQSPYAGIDFRLTTSEIKNPDGSVVFRLDNVEVPKDWSQVASDVLAQKYFRKAGVAARLKKVEEETVPSWLWRSVPDTAALADLPESERYVSELFAKQVLDRLAGCWTYWCWIGGYFYSDE